MRQQQQQQERIVEKQQQQQQRAGFASSAAATAPSSLIVTDVKGFAEAVAGSKKGEGQEYSALVLDCHADWCGPCRILGPNLENVIASQYASAETGPDAQKVRLATLDVDLGQNDRQLGALLQQMNVSGIPAVFVFVDGQMKPELGFTGAIPAPQLEQWFQNVQAAVTEEE
jgi:putative thioredoxin